MSTFGEYYDSMLDDCSEACPTCSGYGASRILKKMDPIAYRCGFVDYIDSISRDKVMCTECGDREITDFDRGEDDEMECEVCRGNEFVCDECGDVFDNDQKNEVDELDLCESCWKEKREEDEEDE